VLKRIFNLKTQEYHKSLGIKIFITIFTIGLILLGIRGRFEFKSPIRVGTAYFCNNSFLNQLGLNPAYTLVHSYIEDQKYKTYQFIDDKVAIQSVQKWLNIEQQNYNSPIARNIYPDTLLPTKPNVVLIIMESMSAAKMGRFGNHDNLTPFLDSISYQSLFFENIYSAGIHTHNGIFGTLFSFPSLYNRHNLKIINEYYGISNVLKKLGYSTTYFTTHDGQFDNVEGFLRANGFENVISQSNYPSSEVKSTLGVPDDYMFRFSLPIIDKLYEQNKPFFVTFLTSSDHGPYIVPEYFHPHTKEITKQIVEYADWSLKLFLDSASQKKWFSNTIFVFVADHGSPIHAIYDISLDYHHIPLIIYAPKILKTPKTIKNIGGQIDVFPTIMGILRLPYINNTLGIDLLREKRPYIFFNDDNKMGVLDNEWLLIFDPKGSSKLFKYKNNNLHDFSKEEIKKAKEMETYAKCNLQVFQYMLKHKNMLSSPISNKSIKN
ncbi:MAG: LTA synthase family protein, partial [Bacteroidales bacterium]